MKYLLLIYSNPENWGHPTFRRNPEFLAMPAAERDALNRQSEVLHREVGESGELLVAAALAGPLNARTVRVRDSLPATTDGPYLEAKEHLAGYLVVDCESEERAIEIASRIPDARFCAVEVHPIMDMSGPECEGWRRPRRPAALASGSPSARDRLRFRAGQARRAANLFTMVLGVAG